MLSLRTEESLTAASPVTIKCADWCNAKSRVVKYSLTWTMSERFNANCEKSDAIRSPTFRLGEHDELEACIAIYPRGDPNTTGDEYVSLYLQIVSSYDSSITAKLVLTMSNISCHTKEMFLTRDTFSPGLGWGFEEMYPRSELWNESSEIVTCTISLVEGSDSATNTAEAECAIPNAGQKRLLDGFKRLCMSDLYSDVTIVVDEEIFSAHKAVLSTQSPVFEAMLASDMQEAKSNVINIVDLDVDVVKEMLRFVYTGTVEDLQDSAQGLLHAADKYGLDDLKAMCEDSLCKHLTNENVCQIFRLADLHRADQLKVKSADYMRRNMLEVQLTEGWKNLKETCQTLLIEFFIEK